MEFSTNSFSQTMSDGASICVNRWITQGEQKAVVLLCHGMVEHSLRYDKMGSIFAENGFVFQAHDNRGHGKTAQYAVKTNTGLFGYLADKNGFERVVDDIAELVAKAKIDFPGKKIFLIAHSFGSFVAQSFCERYGDKIDGCILAGSAGPNRFQVSMGKFLAGNSSLFLGKKHKAYFINKIVFSSYNKRNKNPRTNFDWLTRDSSIVDMYMSDDWCGFVPTAEFFLDMFKGMSKIHKDANIKKIQHGLPIFIIYGTDDPVGGYGKTIHSLFEIYKMNGIKDVTEKPYEKARHELFNEINRDEIYSDVMAWINKRI